MLIEAGGAFVLGIDQEGKGADFSSSGALQSIGKQCRAQLLALLADGYREAAKEDGGHIRIARQFSGKIFRKIGEKQAGSGQGIESGDRPLCAIDGNETGGDPAAHILPRLRLQIAVEGGNAAREAFAVMHVPERFDNEGRFCHVPSLRRRGEQALPVGEGALESVIARRRIEKLFGEGLACRARKPDQLNLGDRLARGIASRRHHEIGQCPPLQVGGALQ